MSITVKAKKPVIYEKDTVKDNASNDVKDHSEDKEE